MFVSHSIAEVFFEYGAFKGTIDLLVPAKDEICGGRNHICDDCQDETCEWAYSGYCPYDKFVEVIPNTFDIYDFKYSNNIDRYLESPQLHIYKYFAEKALGIKIRSMYFVFAQKVQIRQKKTEDLNQFRLRLKNTLQDATVQVKEVSYDTNKVIDFMQNQVNILTCNDYKKTPSKLCDFCEYQGYCENDDELNIAPRRWYEG